MASFVAQNNCSRSQSSSPSSPREIRRAATKRGHPHPSNGACSPQKYDVDAARRGKRRRHNSKDLPLSISATTTRTTRFPSTSSEFHLYPEKERETKIRTRRMSLAAERYGEKDLTNLRANAFGELRRSVAEDGEGFVQRMRDYECSRSKSDGYFKIKDAQELDRKQKCLAGPTCRNSMPHHTLDEDDDEDEVQIFANDDPRVYHRTRSVSLDGGRRYVYTDKRGDKTVAELGLAMANGACGITDYRPLLSAQKVSQEFQVGEMWN